jgi:opacity protein-like surface antigen
MRSRHVTALLGACLALSALGYARPAHADAQLYVGGQVGYNWVLGNDTLDDDIGYGAVLGVDFAGLGASGVALEFTALYASYDAASCGTLASGAGLGNGATELCRGIRNGLDVDANLDDWMLGLALRYNIDFDAGRFYLLAGGELNLTQYEVEAEAIGVRNESSDEIWGAQVGAGLELKLGEHVTIGPDVRYHFLFTDNFDSIDQIEDTDIADVPDFLTVQGRVNVYF